MPVLFVGGAHARAVGALAATRAPATLVAAASRDDAAEAYNVEARY